MPQRTAYVEGLQMLGRRELSVRQLRDRLRERDHAAEDVERAITLLLESGALDDARVAAAYVRTALKVKGRGRLRIRRELHEMGIDREIAAGALAEAFGDVDERTMIRDAIRKKTRGRKIATQAESARLFQYLVRQGFAPETVSAILRTGDRTGRDDGD